MNWMTKLHCDDTGKLLIRLAVGGLLLTHGIGKVKGGIEPINQMLVAKGLPAAMGYGVYIGEVVAPILILIGLWARPAGLIVAINMIVAIALAHSGDVLKLTPQGTWAIELQAFYVLGALAIFFMGAGTVSVTRGQGPLN